MLALNEGEQGEPAEEIAYGHGGAPGDGRYGHTVQALDRPTPDPFIVPDPAEYSGRGLSELVRVAHHFAIQGVPGHSGAPVFWPAQHGMVIAVFTGPRLLGPANTPPISDYEKRGVRLTPDKNAWIQAQ